jgi:hypothetical protein
VSKPASLTGALVQRGRDRAPRLEAPIAELAAAPAPPAELPAPASDEVPLVFVRSPRKEAALHASASGVSELLFFAACCAAFLATFLFVLRF